MNKKTILMIVILSIASTVAIPLINIFLTTPAFTRFVIGHTEEELTDIALDISAILEINDPILDDTILNQKVISKIGESKSLFNLEKIKVFSSTGKIIHSTDLKDIGARTERNFFDSIIRNKKIFSVLVVKKKDPPKGIKTDRTILETYVPILRKKEVIGVFEIYFDMSDLKNEFEGIISRINYIVIGISLLLLSFVIISLAHTYKTFNAQRKTEIEKDKLIEDLTKALNEIKRLRGILPLCSFCKKVRNDSGYWEQVDVYIDKYSGADISHSICPECAKKEYPQEFEDISDEEE